MAFTPSLRPSRLFDQDFGMCITPDDFLLPFYSTYSNYYRPWKWGMQSFVKDFGSTINNEKESFKVTLDVQHFQPNELSVKVANNQIIVEGKHEERKDEHGFISRKFTRRYTLPSDCMPEDVISNLSSDGVLTIVANKKSKPLPKDEKIIPIKLCKSCPLINQAAKTFNADQKDISSEIKTNDSKKNKQIMLKEDHCCLLLKPELLRDAASESNEIIVEKKNTEQEKLKTCQVGTTSEMLEQTFAKSTMSASGEMCDNAAMSKSEVAEQKHAQSSASMSASDETFDKKCGAMSTSGKLGETFAKLTATMSPKDEKFDIFDKAGAVSTAEASEKTFEKSNTAMSTSEKAGHSRLTKSEISELTRMSSKTSESIESSTSYKASMTSNIKEISEDLSDFVSDILCSELDKTLNIKK